MEQRSNWFLFKIFSLIVTGCIVINSRTTVFWSWNQWICFNRVDIINFINRTFPVGCLSTKRTKKWIKILIFIYRLGLFFYMRWQYFYLLPARLDTYKTLKILIFELQFKAVWLLLFIDWRSYSRLWATAWASDWAWTTRKTACCFSTSLNTLCTGR